VHRSHAFRSCDHTGFSTFFRNGLRPRPVADVVTAAVVVVVVDVMLVFLIFGAGERDEVRRVKEG